MTATMTDYLTDTVTALLAAHRERGAEVLPILADALEDAGYPDADDLRRMRSHCYSTDRWSVVRDTLVLLGSEVCVGGVLYDLDGRPVGGDPDAEPDPDRAAEAWEVAEAVAEARLAARAGEELDDEAALQLRRHNLADTSTHKSLWPFLGIRSREGELDAEQFPQLLPLGRRVYVRTGRDTWEAFPDDGEHVRDILDAARIDYTSMYDELFGHEYTGLRSRQCGGVVEVNDGAYLWYIDAAEWREAVEWAKGQVYPADPDTRPDGGEIYTDFCQHAGGSMELADVLTDEHDRAALVAEGWIEEGEDE